MKDNRDNDIKAPDGFLLGGERRVRAGGIILFQRGWWQLPEGWAQQGEYCWVHTIDSGVGGLEVAPPGYRTFYSAVTDKVTCIAERTSRKDAKSGLRKPERKAWEKRMNKLAGSTYINDCLPDRHGGDA